MNERIKELAAQSGMIYYSKTKALDNANDGMTVIPSLDGLEKFAELIVQECAQICKTVGGDQVSNASKDYQVGREMGAEVCYNQIRKHFGVE
jgi:hypothetical protein